MGSSNKCHMVICFCYWPTVNKSSDPKILDVHSADPHQTAPVEQSDVGLHFL